jgi:hypothetical protein
MPTINQTQLNYLQKAIDALGEDACQLISTFIASKKSTTGGFTDRVGKSDVYYTVFGYTLSLLFNLPLDVKQEKNYLQEKKRSSQKDFVHLMSWMRAFYLLEVIDWKQKMKLSTKKALTISFGKELVMNRIQKKCLQECKELMDELNFYRSMDGGYNHKGKQEKDASVYANYLAFTFFEDLGLDASLKEIKTANANLQLSNGAFVNDSSSQKGVCSSTAAGLILNPNTATKEWLKALQIRTGGFKASETTPFADLLSSATAQFALALTTTSASENEILLDFINLHWDESGGFFGSIVDATCDVEYTFYGLLGIGSAL